jgi:hypothetical protein
MSPGRLLQRLGGLEKLLVRSVRGAVEPNNFVVAVMAISPGNLKATYASAMIVVRRREAGGGDSCLLGFFGGCHWRPRCECRCIDILGLARTMQRVPTRARVPHPMRRSAHQLIFQRLIRSSSNARHHPYQTTKPLENFNKYSPLVPVRSLTPLGGAGATLPSPSSPRASPDLMHLA